MKKIFFSRAGRFTALLLAAALVFGGCKNLSDDEDITIVSNETIEETEETYLYDVVLYSNSTSEGDYTKRTYNDNYYEGSSSYPYTSSVYDDEGKYYNGYLKYYYSQYEEKWYKVTSAKLVKTSYKHRNYTKYVLTLYGYLYAKISIDSSGEKSYEYTKDHEHVVGELSDTFTFYKAGGKFYRDEGLSKEVSFPSDVYYSGNFDSSNFVLRTSFDDTSEYVASVEEDDSYSSSYYTHYKVYKKTKGSSASFTMFLKRK